MGTIPAGGPEPPKDAGTNDRRVALRRSVVDSHLITVDLAFQSGALLLDLSETGMGVQALASAPMGTTTPLHFDLPETGGRVDGTGRIAWTDSSGRLGIRFEKIGEMGRLHLAQWLARDRRPLVAPGPNVAVPTWPPPHTRDEVAALRRDLKTEKLKGDRALAFTVERMLSVTRATGAAIALEDGGAIVCRASSGNAPGVGACVDPNSGLSGECVRTGEIVRCEDTETDPRADRLVCRRLELRSIVIVPIRVQGRPAGVLEAFSSRAHAFQSSDVLLLRRVADLVAEIAVRQPESAPSLTPGPQTLMAAVLLEPFIPEPQAEGTTPPMREETRTLDVEKLAPPPPPVVVKPQPAVKPLVQPTVQPVTVIPAQRAPAVEQPAAKAKEAAAEMARLAAPTPTVAPIERPAPPPIMPTPIVKPEIKPEVEKHPESRVASVEKSVPSAEVSVPLAASIAVAPPEKVVVPPPVSSPSLVSTRAMAAAASVSVPPPVRPRPVPVQEDGGESPKPFSEGEAALPSLAVQRPSPWNMRVASAAILVAVLVVGGWQVWRTITPPKGTPMDSELKQAKPAAPPATNPAAPLLAANTTAVPDLANVAPPAAKPAAPSPTGVAAKPVNRPAAAKSAPAQKPPEPKQPEPITVASPDVTNVAAAEPPSVSALSSRSAGESSAISNVLHTPVAAPTLDTTKVSQRSGGKLLQKINPVYPSSAMGMQGEVVLKATINRDGKVIGVQIVSGQPVLAQAAAAAVKRWRYEPFLLNGFPIEVENTIVVNFKAPGP